ncbi:MAG: pyridoxal-dependent decarboxylase, partial [Pseudomonadota bacterium]
MTEKSVPDINSHSLLEPEDWSSFREAAHRALDQALDFMQTRPTESVWKPLPDSLKTLGSPLPLETNPIDHVVNEFTDAVFPYTLGNTHPRFWGWVHGSGTATGVIAQMLGAAINANMGGREHAPIYIEKQLIQWLLDLFEFGTQGSGIICSGTSTATLLGLAVARHKALGEHARTRGNVSGLVVYSSGEAHVSVCKALELMGLGSEALRVVPADADLSSQRDRISATPKAA